MVSYGQFLSKLPPVFDCAASQILMLVTRSDLTAIGTDAEAQSHLKSETQDYYIALSPDATESRNANSSQLGGSWVVISGVISPLVWVIIMVTLLITPCITTQK